MSWFAVPAVVARGAMGRRVKRVRAPAAAPIASKLLPSLPAIPSRINAELPALVARRSAVLMAAMERLRRFQRLDLRRTAETGPGFSVRLVLGERLRAERSIQQEQPGARNLVATVERAAQGQTGEALADRAEQARLMRILERLPAAVVAAADEIMMGRRVALA